VCNEGLHWKRIELCSWRLIGLGWTRSFFSGGWLLEEEQTDGWKQQEQI
jgi:hypothetical protein